MKGLVDEDGDANLMGVQANNGSYNLLRTRVGFSSNLLFCETKVDKVNLKDERVVGLKNRRDNKLPFTRNSPQLPPCLFLIHFQASQVFNVDFGILL